MSEQSHGVPARFKCPKCANEDQQLISRNVNATRFPVYRGKIFDGSFHRFTCSACSSTYFVDIPFHYCDFTRDEWILMCPANWEPKWRQYASDARASADACYEADDVPAILRGSSSSFWVRSVFGLPALREKLVIHEAGIDDVRLEIFKFELMRRIDGVPPSAESRPRCVQVTDTEMLFSIWVPHGGTLKPQALKVPRSEFEAAGEYLDKAEGLAAQLRETPYVDIGRFLVVEDAEPMAA